MGDDEHRQRVLEERMAEEREQEVLRYRVNKQGETFEAGQSRSPTDSLRCFQPTESRISRCRCLYSDSRTLKLSSADFAASEWNVCCSERGERTSSQPSENDQDLAYKVRSHCD